jgi:hypothetical protein
MFPGILEVLYAPLSPNLLSLTLGWLLTSQTPFPVAEDIRVWTFGPEPMVPGWCRLSVFVGSAVGNTEKTLNSF